MGEMIDERAIGSEKVSRRIALRRFAKAGVLATAGAGLLELAGVADASARTTRHAAKMRVYSLAETKDIVTLPQGVAGPDSCCTGYLSEHDCNGSCPPGYYCYIGSGCGLNGFACLHCNGTPTCRYCNF